MKIRIRKVDNIYISEIQIRSWTGIKSWVPFITFHGLTEAYRFTSEKAALRETMLQIEKQIIKNSNDYAKSSRNSRL